MSYHDLMTAEDVRNHMRVMVDGFGQMGVSQNGVARRIGVSNGHLSRVLRGEKEPGEKVLSWIGLEAATYYRRRKS